MAVDRPEAAGGGEVTKAKSPRNPFLALFKGTA
jgi:hypothetical protein